MKFEGIITALITPFNEDGTTDFHALERLINKQIDAKIDSLVLGGSTGEGSCLSDEDYFALLDAAIGYAKGKINIIAGMTAAGTDLACEKIKRLNNMAINGIMCTLPHYVKPEQEGVFAHFQAIDKISKLPIMLYLHPGRTGCNINDEILVLISHMKNVAAIKDASDDLLRPKRLQSKVAENFNFLSGDDANMIEYSLNGGSGVVSVCSNIFPKLCKKIEYFTSNKQLDMARTVHKKIMSFTDLLFTESNPIGIKYAAYELNLCKKYIKLPLTIMKESNAKPLIEKIYEIEELEKNA